MSWKLGSDLDVTKTWDHMSPGVGTHQCWLPDWPGWMPIWEMLSGCLGSPWKNTDPESKAPVLPGGVDRSHSGKEKECSQQIKALRLLKWKWTFKKASLKGEISSKSELLKDNWGLCWFLNNLPFNKCSIFDPLGKYTTPSETHRPK